MPLRELVEKAIETAGSQVKLAEMLGIKQQNISAWKTGVRYCTTATRIELCKISGYDLKTALLEQVVEDLDTSDKMQAEAAKTLKAVLAAFPKSGVRIS
ncbi:helix-turn-helix domain-containing protein [Comamonas sp. Z3]|uniref:YdaS family helix-turn-helix protein n=1 Tax=Comamonas sp. Z3 TaxID=2601247 RepID=UPI0011E7728E|nr:YdaS family helix-turn-helix protein [Comamonas sp. Z3]TYK72788.1 helix-turn-helix domain-containing protein [Comamonas sp. Z3]